MQKVTCSNCDWTGSENEVIELQYATDLHERLDAGDIVPHGECPRCKAFVYAEVHDRWTASTLYNKEVARNKKLAHALNRLLASHRRIMEAACRGPINERDYDQHPDVAAARAALAEMEPGR